MSNSLSSTVQSLEETWGKLTENQIVMQTEPLLFIQQKGVGERQGREGKKMGKEVVGAEHTNKLLQRSLLLLLDLQNALRMNSQALTLSPKDCCFCVQKKAGKWQLPNKYWYLTSSAYQVLFPAQNLQQRKQVTNSLQSQKRLQTAKTMFILQLHSPFRRPVFASHKK